MNVLDYIVHETVRQSGTMREALGMYDAYTEAVLMHVVGSDVTENDLISWVSNINGITGYRKVPAVFNQGVPAVPAQQIPNAIARLIDAINDDQTFIESRDGYAVGFNRADYLVKEFLEIHPFADGNGRVGSLLWNLLRGSINDPEPMPYFFGEN